MIVLVQLLLKYALLAPFGVSVALDGLGIALLILATISIAAAGNIINDIYDVATDNINKPDKVIVGKTIPEKTAYTLFMACNCIGIAVGFYISHSVGKSAFFTIFVLISALLYMYAFYLKSIVLVGNILISILVATSILIVGLFELIPTITEFNRDIQITFFKLIMDYAVFAFMINLLREMVKDIEDIDGDYQTGIYTLPIAIGRERTRNLVVVLNSISLAILIFYTVSGFYKQPLMLIYFLGAVIGPLMYVGIKLCSATTKPHFHHVSTLYKWIMLFGMLSLLGYTFIL